MEAVSNTDLLEINRANVSDCVIALAGNPNVGKSTVFNNLTGMRQHTGKLAGKNSRKRPGRS